ncbi:phosphoglycerate dehydrogenase [Acetivibrio sp. MSJd-27]|uniref:phosphoglycerate dehydrogenase n=1 Tax=Acetivibrio sp. MSJd-27 TaxID=2841523 RepID=UPI001C10CAD2|nr:phosphoglycerate dehydrogenase [Acetivibrio sp. MSJd-27]MBU5450667.1 phosphoglycerate dehydrogenase [Acetivibrio sp. MSJd-27]
MYNILTLNKISHVGLSKLDQTKYAISDNTETPDGILLRSFNMHDYDMPESLLAIGRAGAGVNNIPLDKCTEKGIVVFNTPGANANAVKELVIAALLLSSRNIVGGIDWAKELVSSDTVEKDVEKGKSAFVGPEIAGKTLGVVGLGAIGVLVANAAEALGMNVIGYDPYISIDAAWGLSTNVKRAINRNEIFENCDYITLHVPLTKETEKMVSSVALETMKDGVRIINCSRADLVDADAMKSALDSEKVACYVTDFPNKALLNYKNVISIPHLGASTPESEENCAVMAVREIKEYIERGNITNSVNFPSVQLPKTSQSRITIMHKNIPNMLSQISNEFAKNDLNIDNMMNKSKNDVAYTIVDVDSEVNGNVIESLSKIDGIIRVRLIQ